MFFRHVCFYGAVLVRVAVQSPVECNSVLVEKHFYGAFGETHIYRLLDVLVGNRILYFIYRDVILYCTVSIFHWGSSNWEIGSFCRNSLSCVWKTLLRLSSIWVNGSWLCLSGLSWNAWYNSRREKTFRLRSAAMILVEIVSTALSALTLSLGLRILAGITMVL